MFCFSSVLVRIESERSDAPSSTSRFPHPRRERTGLEAVRGEQGPHLGVAEQAWGIDQLIDAVAAHQLLHLDALRDERAQVFDRRIDALAAAHDGQPPIIFNQHIARCVSNHAGQVVLVLELVDKPRARGASALGVDVAIAVRRFAHRAPRPARAGRASPPTSLRPFLGGAVWPSTAGSESEWPAVRGPPDARCAPGAAFCALPVCPDFAEPAACGVNMWSSPPLSNPAPPRLHPPLPSPLRL